MDVIRHDSITGNNHWSDSRDARQLARLARVDPALSNPVDLRGSAEQADLFVIRARAMLVEARTMLINFARAITKALGHRLPASTSQNFAERVKEAVRKHCDRLWFPCWMCWKRWRHRSRSTTKRSRP